MKFPAMFYVVITTLVLLTVIIMTTMNCSFKWVFYTTVVGQILVVVMVYKVLTDNYRTEKTFEHMYEDCPVNPKDLQSLPKKRENF